MSIFREIDQALAEYQRTLQSTREAVRALGGAYVRADELGFWRCSYRPTRGVRLSVTLRARGHLELLTLLEAAPDRPGRRPRKSGGQPTESSGTNQVAAAT